MTGSDWLVIVAAAVAIAVLVGQWVIERRKDRNRSKLTVALLLLGIVAVLTQGAMGFLQRAEQRREQESREREQRLWQVRQDHLARLRPVFRDEAKNLAEIERRVASETRVTEIEGFLGSGEPSLTLLLFPHVLSRDVANHYGEYWSEKDRLRGDLEEQDREFRATYMLFAERLSLPAIVEGHRGTLARSLLEKCLDKGPGVVLTTGRDQYTYRTATGSGTASGPGAKPSDDQIAAFRAFGAFRVDSDIAGRCERLKARAPGLAERAKKLSAAGLALTERTTLPGDCEHTKLH